MSTMELLPDEHPIKQAWNSWSHNEDGANALHWAEQPEHVAGSLWAAFLAGWKACQDGGGDEVLGLLRQAGAEAKDDPAKSRELSLVLMKIDEAILWRQRDLQLKTPPVNEATA